MKVTVCAQIVYYYDVELPEDEDDIISYCDCEDPVYSEICKTFVRNHIDYNGEIISVRNEETDEDIYCL